jgi:IclR family transcriptional regulator, pca regulon regulatory protein
MLPPPKQADLIDGLVRGIAVLHAFTREHPQHTASSLATALEMSRAAARRFLITLEHLGYAATDGRTFWLTPKMLSFANTYQASEQLVRTVEPYLQALAQRIGQAVSFGVVDGDDVLYLARASGPRMLSTNIMPGTRLPLQCAAAGWAMMAQWPAPQLADWLSAVQLRKFTPHNVMSKKELQKQLTETKTAGYALLENQYEMGMRGLSVAVMDGAGRAVGGLTVGMATSMCTTAQARALYAEPLKEAAVALGRYL